jgi:hypothetical protein
MELLNERVDQDIQKQEVPCDRQPVDQNIQTPDSQPGLQDTGIGSLLRTCPVGLECAAPCGAEPVQVGMRPSSGLT